MPTDHGVGRPQSRRYSPEEKQAAVRMVRSLRAETGTMTVTSEENARVKELEQENRELRRANEILRRAASFFGAELDRQQRM